MINLAKNVFISFNQTFDTWDKRCVGGALITGAVISPDFRKGLAWTPVIIASHAFAATLGDRIFSSQDASPNPLKKKISTFFEDITPSFLTQIPMIGCIFAVPFLEEKFFRGVLQPLLISKIGRVAGIILSSGIFGILHYDNSGGKPYVPALVTGVAGTIFGTLASRVSLAAAFGAHVGNNATIIFGFEWIKNCYNLHCSSSPVS